MADSKAAMVAGGAFLIGACFGAYFYQGPIRAMFARKRGKKMFTVKDWDTWGFKVTPPAEDRFSNDLQRHYFHGHYHHHHHSDAPCYDNNLDDSAAAPYESSPPPHADGAAGCRGLSSVVNSRQDATDVHYGTLLELGHKTCVLEAQEDRAKLADAMTKDTITEQQFSRNRELFGIEGQLRVHEAFVVVVGLGGVGSHAALHLVRTGVGNIRIVDHDHVTISSLNRHAVANRGDVGHPKAVVMKHHFNRIFPECNVDAQPVMLTAHSADELLSGSPDFVLDCIDNIDTKVALLKTCFDKRIPVISATGAGTRMDVTRVRVVDIKDSAVDPLARAVRHRLRRLHNITEGIQVVISTEPPRRKPLPLEECVGLEYDCSSTDLSDFQMLPNFRIRTIPVCSPVPAVFGAAMAAHVVAALAQQELYPEPVVRFTEEQYRVLYDRLLQSEEDGLVDLDLNDVVYLVKELWQGRSARDPHAHGEGGRARFRAVNSMGLTRWDRSQPASVSNMVLLTFQEIEAHERTTLEQIRMEEPEYYERVTCLLKRASAENEFFIVRPWWGGEREQQ